MGDIGTLPLLNGLGVVAVCFLFTWLVMTGKLWPNHLVQAIIRESQLKDERLAIKDQQLSEALAQNSELLEVGRTTNQIMRSLPVPTSDGAVKA